MGKRTTSKLGVTTLEDISTLILQSHDLDETLSNIVHLVAKRMGTEVCSIYLLEEDQQVLRLRASKGLSKKAVGKITLQIGEGLIGLAAEKRQVVAIQEPESHPRFRYFKETGEERFHSFLGIPLFDRQTPIGVIAIQTKDPRQFTTEETSALSTIAFQISSIVINARLLDFVRMKEAQENQGVQHQKTSRPLRLDRAPEPAEGPSRIALRGTVAYPGLASGPAHILDDSLGMTETVDEGPILTREHLKKFEQTLEKTRIQTLFLEKRVAERLSQDDAAIFHTHLMILEDRSFLEKVREEIRHKHSVSYAIKHVVTDYIEAFERMEDPYLQERAADIKDIGRRLLANLSENSHNNTLQLKHPGILIAREILPSDMAALDHDQIRGIVTEAGGRNSHAVIMAKSLGIPALVGVKGAVKASAPAEKVILDANSGCFYVDPLPHVVEEYRRLEEDAGRELHRLEEIRELPAVTRDGHEITLRANIGLVSDVEIALRNGAKGVGLYRTEFPYMTRSDFPDRRDQYLLYRKVIDRFPDYPVTIRTLDIGGDKALPYFNPPKEDNPFMGWRSVRVSLDNRDIFKTQIEAILMAGVHGKVKLLFPMISGMEEVRACKEVIAEAKADLQKEGIPFAQDVPIGVMIEVPAAVQMISQLAREVDFFALGTNDLIQYMLAADRNNPLVNKYYDPLHPAILQVLDQVARTAREQEKGLCLCGEMASDPMNFLALVGMGISEFSMPGPLIPRIKAFLRDIRIETARKTAAEILDMTESAAIRSHLVGALKDIERIH